MSNRQREALKHPSEQQLKTLQDVAESFYLSANLLNQKMLMTPMVVNLAFSCELFIKALLAKENGEIPLGHFLDDLYNTLPDSIKNDFNIDLVKLKENRNRFGEWRYLYEPSKYNQGDESTENSMEQALQVLNNPNSLRADVPFLVDLIEKIKNKLKEQKTNR